MPQLTTRLIVMLVAAVLIVGVILFGVNQCQGRKSADKQAEVSREQGQASVGAGQEALNTVSNVAASDASTDASVAQGRAEIGAAAKGQKAIAAKRAACRFKAYANTPQCKETVR